MDVVLLLIMAAAGLSAVSSFVDRQYYFVDEMKNMTEAQSYCREKYTDLATVHSMEVVKLLNDSFGSNTSKAWIGLYDDQDTWSWSLSNTRFNNFAPSNSDRREHCTLNSSVDELWDAGGCEEHINAICFDVSGSSVTFVFTNIISMNWTEAQSYCRAHYTDLASMRKMTENQKTYEGPRLQIQAPVSVQERVPAWEPARVSLYRDPWKWSDRFKSSFRYWARSHPHSENCVAALPKGGIWVSQSCKSKIPFICYKHVPISKQVIKLRVEKNSNVNLNDKAVQKEIIVQIKKKLRDQGLDDNVELMWRTQQDGQVFHKEDEL
ncbi:hypothetical protein NQZ68_009885 [Dissostichus eleginoides]|nr:hypothetical protein NQZ68_009883 [Dissostichus eleginoides]KAI9525205.1 hypothetical protein NQZ68_009885 [Dissostichus eleginoides]